MGKRYNIRESSEGAHGYGDDSHLLRSQNATTPYLYARINRASSGLWGVHDFSFASVWVEILTLSLITQRDHQILSPYPEECHFSVSRHRPRIQSYGSILFLVGQNSLFFYVLGPISTFFLGHSVAFMHHRRWENSEFLSFFVGVCLHLRVMSPLLSGEILEHPYRRMRFLQNYLLSHTLYRVEAHSISVAPSGRRMLRVGDYLIKYALASPRSLEWLVIYGADMAASQERGLLWNLMCS